MTNVYSRFATTPMELVKIQMQLQYKHLNEGKITKKQIKSPLTVVREAGLTGMYKG